MRGRNTHVLAILGDRATSHVNALGLQPLRDLFIGQWMRAVFFLNHLLPPALQQQQRGGAAAGALHGFGEEVAQLKHTLRGVSILAGHGSANGRRMDADLFGHILDHHGAQLVQAALQEVALSTDHRLTDLHDGLTPLLDVLHQHDGRGEAIFDIVPDFFIRLLVAVQHLAVLRIQSQLRHVVVVQLNQVVVAVLGDVDVGFHLARAGT